MKKYLLATLSLLVITVGVAYAAPSTLITGDNNLNKQMNILRKMKDK